jgi:hypothetical protein
MDNAALRVYQHSFHKKLSNMVISFRAVEQPVESLPVHRDDDSISSGSEATVKEVKEGTKVAESTEFIVGEYVKLNESDSPNLLKLFSGASIVPKHHLNALLLELFKIFGNKSSVSVDFQYKNGNRGCAIIVPRVKHQDSFKKQAKKLQWIESLLDHVAGSDQHDENDAAKWMSYYIGKKYDGPFTLALEALGLPVVQRLDEKSTLAMWADANINYTQQRIIKKHLRLHFGKRLFIPDTTFNADHEHYYIPTHYNEYKHYKNGDRMQKPERCQYWCRDPSLVVTTELSRMLDYLDPNLITTRFSSLLASGSSTLIAGADQGQGA